MPLKYSMRDRTRRACVRSLFIRRITSRRDEISSRRSAGCNQSLYVARSTPTPAADKDVRTRGPEGRGIRSKVERTPRRRRRRERADDTRGETDGCPAGTGRHAPENDPLRRTICIQTQDVYVSFLPYVRRDTLDPVTRGVLGV